MISHGKNLILGTLLLGCGLISSNASSVALHLENDIHDPSTIVLENSTYWTFGTGDGIASRYSDGLLGWQHGAPVFELGTWPNWIDESVPGFEGHFWAPDIIEMNNKYYLYYSAYHSPNRTSFNSAIGVAVTDSLANPNWQDLGMVVSSKTEPLTPQGEPTNTIDAGLFRDASNNVWMAYGSHYGGVFITQIDPSTGKRMNSSRYPVVGDNGAWNEYEAAQVTYINGHYYMFVNLGECCAGDDSTYYIVVGRSDSPTGPYLDKNGVDLYNYGGSTLLATEGDYIGPGHYGYYNNNGQNLVSIHYYDGTTADGWPARLDLLEMSFDSAGWPVLTRDFIVDGGIVPTPVTANLTNGSTYTVGARHSGKLLDVARTRNGSPSGTDGTNVYQWSVLNDGTQRWVFNQVNDYYWSIHPAHATSKALDVYDFGEVDGTNVNLWDYWGGAAQQWRFIDVGDGYFQAVARHSSKCLNIENASTADGANAEQWSCNTGSQSQHFLFTPAD
jgi:arabinan endo-1,5-alpha-L-arabinosidase